MKKLNMIHKTACLALFFAAFSTFVLAQTPETKKGRPDIPGSFVVDLGINRLTEKPNELKYGFWGSRTVNVYYYYDLRFGKSKFSFHPGIGLGMDRFKLMNYKHYLPNDTVERFNPTLIFDNVGNTTFVDAAHYIYDGDTLGQINLASSFSVKKSMLATNYVDVPFEFRFSTMPDDPGRSFKVAIGGRIGYLIGSHTKVKYKEDGEFKKIKNEQNFNLSALRYGVYTRIYIGNFNFFGFYNLSPVFEENKGPGRTKASSFTVGISLSSF